VRSGERVYQARVGNGGSFQRVTVAADGKIYVASEDGDIFVFKAGPAYELLATNAMVRSSWRRRHFERRHHRSGLKDVFAIGRR